MRWERSPNKRTHSAGFLSERDEGIFGRRVIWLSDEDKSKGYAVDFSSISLHAVSRDPETYPSPCIYARIETEEDHDAVSEDPDSEGAEAVELSKIAEMRLVPSDPSQLDTLFDIFCQCAELNPEPNEDGEEENTWFFGDKDMAVDGIGNDSEWQFLENLANPIGYANGDHDLAQTILEVNFLRFCYDTCKLQKLSFEVYS
ncbi:chloride conductance regulatory protein ICln-like [Asparagus officinalis]|uniref:chloride conductance regulatory protein ICln-like n=1 Tax=Asparagus officinalis TaxID=4686 RepID=UPI00098E822A|nr:chloride conductance regulatory protein ICln-like [Asparagus officinalis]